MRRLLAICSLLVTVACGPVYQTDYEIVPPPTQQGAMCANNCLMAQQNCRMNQQMQQNQCEQIERLRAQNEYLAYVNRQQRENRPISRTERDFYYPYQCGDNGAAAMCEADYRICHTNCGGKIIPHTYCTAFCDQQ